MTRIVYCLPDVHLPWTSWQRIEEFAAHIKADKKKKSNDVSIVQLGDLIDAMAWSRYPKGPDAPNAQLEWDQTEIAVDRLHKLLPEMTVLLGNHCIRPIKKAVEAQLPRQLIKGLHEVFDTPKWKWHIGSRAYEKNGIVYLHGDEFPISPSNPGLAASRLGKSIVFGHTHQASISYVNIFEKSIFALNAGCIIDENAVCFQYSAKNPRRCWQGYGKIVDGVPSLIPLP